MRALLRRGAGRVAALRATPSPGGGVVSGDRFRSWWLTIHHLEPVDARLFITVELELLDELRQAVARLADLAEARALDRGEVLDRGVAWVVDDSAEVRELSERVAVLRVFDIAGYDGGS